MIASDALRTLADAIEQPSLPDADIDRIAERLEARLAVMLPVFDEWLTPEQTGDVLQVGTDTLTAWERAGLLSPSRVGSRIVRFSRRDIASMMDDAKVGDR